MIIRTVLINNKCLINNKNFHLPVRVAERHIHVILDNLSTHKRNDEWLAAHQNVTFHFTPTSASWLNQVEIWFGIFQRKTLRNASFISIDQLIGAIGNFIAAYNENATPSSGASAR